MTVEIRELVLHARVIDDDAAGGVDPASAEALQAQLDDIRRDMLDACARLVADALARERSR